MTEPRNSGLISQKPYVQLLVSLFVLLLVSLILLIVSLLLGKLIFGDITVDTHNLHFISSEQLAYLKFVQSFQHISMFLIPSIVVAYVLCRRPGEYLGLKKNTSWTVVLLVILLAIVITPLTGNLGIWNAKMQLPSYLSGLELWMRAKEGEAAVITEWLIKSENIKTLLLNILILAIIPALGEEFLFRGILQKLFTNTFKSAHLAIFVTALLFSASHLQFFGFLPRLLLGLVFGYLYYWSGSIWLPVVAHFINNLIPAILAYFIGWESINSNVEELSTQGSYYFLLPLLICIVLLFVIGDLLRNSSSSEETLPG